MKHVCMFVCVCERERKRARAQRERERRERERREKREEVGGGGKTGPDDGIRKAAEREERERERERKKERERETWPNDGIRRAEKLKDQTNLLMLVPAGEFNLVSVAACSSHCCDVEQDALVCVLGAKCFSDCVGRCFIQCCDVL